MAVIQQESPIEIVKSAIETSGGTYSVKGIYHITNCPGPHHQNGDRNPSLHFWETIDNDGNTSVDFCCWSGQCTPTEVLRGYGISLSRMPGIYTPAKPSRPVITMLDLSKHKLLRHDLLFNLGVTDHVFIYHRKDGTPYKVRGVKISYYTQDGTEYERCRNRTALIAKEGTIWNEGDEPLIPYGLQTLQKAKDAGYLVIPEGESDWWTLYYHNFPAISVPGAYNAKVLDGSFLNDIPTIYAIQEKTDAAGQNFPYAVQVQLRKTGYTGQILRVPLRTLTGAKDPNELHKRLFDKNNPHTPFREAFQQALDQAKPMHTDTGQVAKKYEQETDTSEIDKILAETNREALFDAVPLLAQLSRALYLRYKQKIKETFGKNINLNDLDAAISESRKSSTIVQERLDLDHIAQAFYERYHDCWAYDTQNATWREWVGTHWQEPMTDESGKFAIDKLIVNLLHEFELDVKSNSMLDCVHRLARGKCEVRFLSTSDLVNFKNGTLHVTSMQIMEHCKDDHMLYCLDYDYAPGHHPQITAFLQDMLCIIQEDGTRVPDFHAMQAYMAHIGLALVGDTTMHNFCVLYGAKRAGKSTLLRLANAVCGHVISDYADYAGDSLFSPELEGKRARFVRNKQRIVCADEVSQDALRHEGVIKNMAAHSGTEARGMNKDEQDGNQWHPKLLLSTNDMPHYKDISGAIKDRIIYLHAPYMRPREERNPNLFKQLLLPELSAFAHSCIVLAKAVLDRWYYPQSVNMKRLAATAETNGNALKAFIEEMCAIGKDAKCPTGLIYEKVKQYREDNGHAKNYSKLSMVSDLKDMNIGIYPGGKTERYDGKPTKLLYGIRLREDDEEVQEHQAGLCNDPLLLPMPEHLSNDGCNDCNGHVTITAPDRYILQNGSTGQSTLHQNGNCNDVTIELEKISTRNHLPLETKGVGSSMGLLEHQKTVTSLHRITNQPVEQAQIRNDSQKTSLQTVTPIVTLVGSDPQSLLLEFTRQLMKDTRTAFKWNVPASGYPSSNVPRSEYHRRLQLCVNSTDPVCTQAAMAIMHEYLEKNRAR